MGMIETFEILVQKPERYKTGGGGQNIRDHGRTVDEKIMKDMARADEMLEKD